MILILGKNLVYWSGIFTGVSLFCFFLGCRFINFKGNKILIFFQRKHQEFLRLSMISALIHFLLAILRANFNIWL